MGLLCCSRTGGYWEFAGLKDCLSEPKAPKLGGCTLGADGSSVNLCCRSPNAPQKGQWSKASLGDHFSLRVQVPNNHILTHNL